MNERDNPTSIEAEQAIIGVVMLNNEAWHAGAYRLKAEQFSEAAHQEIWDVISKLVDNNRVASPVTVGKYFEGEMVPGTTWAQYIAKLAAAHAIRTLAARFARRNAPGAAQLFDLMEHNQ